MLAEQVLIDTLSYYDDTLAVICYHVSQTYYTEEAEERETFYNTGFFVPFVIFDTLVVWEANPDDYKNAYIERIELARGVPPYFNLYISDASASQTVGSFNLKIVTADTIQDPDDEIVTFITILEDSLPGFYGTFNHVCRDQFHFPMNLAYPDSLDTTIVFSHSIPIDKMKTVVFIQNLDTKEVMQAIISPFEEE